MWASEVMAVVQVGAFYLCPLEPGLGVDPLRTARSPPKLARAHRIRSDIKPYGALHTPTLTLQGKEQTCHAAQQHSSSQCLIFR